ncbi:MAG TPA: CHASE domain-containing protein [Pyrinomonadaceae bacterium]|nr:CHASE domain-containing protein [Pyrinomonadaceae bacterium]
MHTDSYKTSLPSKRLWVPYFILLVALLLTLLAAYYVSASSEARDRLRFQNAIQDSADGIENRLDTYIALLRAGSALFIVDQDVTREEFRNYVGSLGLHANYPGMQGLGFSARVSAEESRALVARLRQQGVPDFQIRPADPRSEYHTIIYLEPLDNRNKVALGFDMFTEATRREAMERARDTSLPAASGPVTLLQEIDEHKQIGFLIYVPVYRGGQTPATVEARREALQGFVYSPFRAGDLLRGIFGNEAQRAVDFRVYDGDEESGGGLLHDYQHAGEQGNASYKPRFTATTKLPVAGRTWSLSFVTRPEFDAASGMNLVPFTLAGGILVSLLLFGLTLVQTRARAAAERAASELEQSLAERKQINEALRESEERYRELFENANDIVFTLDLEGNLTSMNKAGEQVSGYSREEFLGQSITSILTPESVEVMWRMRNRKIAGEASTNYEVELITRDGRKVLIEVSSRLIYDNNGPIGIQGTARDITERKRVEEALHEADQRAIVEYERLLERIAGLAQALGTARELLTVYRALREFAVASVPCVGIFISLYDPEREWRTAAYAWGDEEEADVSALPPMPVSTDGPNSRAVKTGEIIITDDYMTATKGHPSVLIGPDNGLRPQSAMAVPMAVRRRIVGTLEVQSYTRAAYTEHHATAMRMAANLAAITIENVRLLEHESRARAIAEESNRLKDEFLATVSHELRTPLTSIMGWSQMLRGGKLDERTAALALETIERNARAQSQIIDDILDVSRIITGKLNIDVKPVELINIIEEAVNAARPAANAKNIQIATVFDTPKGFVRGDANRLQQVVWNLLSNAVKFTNNGGRVQIRLEHSATDVSISLKDTGQGISPDFLPHVFERFRQADSTTTRQHGGLGLGLAIVRHLVELHGGTVHAESEGEGRGATFTVRLPLTGTLAEASASQAGPVKAKDDGPIIGSQGLAGLHVLLVDDEKDTLAMLRVILEQKQVKVTAASSASEALKILELSRPDLLISDIGMPDQDGYELMKRIRKLDLASGGAIPAVALTAYARDDDRQRSKAAGYQVHLSKPVEPLELFRVLVQLTTENENGSSRNGDQKPL